ncbi:uncharacterized protein LOC106180183 [Lingula anatina]|uniref:Uncharacterized protein LOC106180183 n=1 Tax=Lingula anatina TaxID=7574 RepID=A0A1S3KAT5_LINAN|nr:uncharacterized protein LOC106180183 [Lingula anatina]|eukprot:XP_013419554.1 uncharacterized protein LOC106180183 [Lingula anatina]
MSAPTGNDSRGCEDKILQPVCEMSTASTKCSTSKDLLHIGGSNPDFLVISKKSAQPVKNGLKTYRTEPSSVLSRVKSFLPKMEEAQLQIQEILKSNPEKLDIEHIDDAEAQVIEMNLALVEQEESSDTSSDENEAETVSDSDTDIEFPCSSVTEKNIKLSKNRRRGNRCKIEEVGETSSKNDKQQTEMER